MAMARASSGLQYPERFYAAASYVGFDGSASPTKTLTSKFAKSTSLLLYSLYQQVPPQRLSQSALHCASCTLFQYGFLFWFLALASLCFCRWGHSMLIDSVFVTRSEWNWWIGLKWKGFVWLDGYLVNSLWECLFMLIDLMRWGTCNLVMHVRSVWIGFNVICFRCYVLTMFWTWKHWLLRWSVSVFSVFLIDSMESFATKY